MADMNEIRQSEIQIIDDSGKAKQGYINSFSFPQIPALKPNMVQSSMGPFEKLDKLSINRVEDTLSTPLFILYSDGTTIPELKISLGFIMARSNDKSNGFYQPRQVFTFYEVTIEDRITGGGTNSPTIELLSCKFADFTVTKEALSSVWQFGGSKLIRLKR
jgi:hypothetical protein